MNTTHPRFCCLNLLRVGAALCILMYHIYNMRCDFYFLNGFIKNADYFMTLFFMLSGFCLYNGYYDKPMETLKQMVAFWRKRFLAVYPTYFLLCLVWYAFYSDAGTVGLRSVLFSIPLELMGLQGTLSGFFYLHNSGSWFFVCCFSAISSFLYLKRWFLSWRPARIESFSRRPWFWLYRHRRLPFVSPFKIFITIPSIVSLSFLLGCCFAVLFRKPTKRFLLE